jgi:signal transduction histidine kinase
LSTHTIDSVRPFGSHRNTPARGAFDMWARALWVLLAIVCLGASFATQAFNWRVLVRVGLPFMLLAVIAIAIAALRIAELQWHLQHLTAALARNAGEQSEAALPDSSGPEVIKRLAHAINVRAHHRACRQAELLHVLAAYAHDLRTPLTRMNMRSELVDDVALREALARDLAEMAELVEGSLSCVRMQCSVQEPMRAFDADGLLAALIDDYRDAGRVVKLEGQVGCALIACPHALRRVLVNLIDNALRYGEDVRLSVKVEKQRLVLAVLDSGPGIAPARLEAVFAAWYRAPETVDVADAAQGCGLGLAIARRLTLAMCGELELSNRVAGGLEARLTLPLLAA